MRKKAPFSLFILTGLLVAGATTLAWAHVVAGDFITAGGWVLSDSPHPPAPARANFGAAGGCKNGAFWGHLTHVDHGFPSNLKIKHETITSYESLFEGPDEPNGQPTGGRRIQGTASVSQPVSRFTACSPGAPATFQLNLTDNGEPGHDDIYELILCGGTLPCEFALHCYYAYGNLGEGQTSGGGNVQLHRGNPSNSCPGP